MSINLNKCDAELGLEVENYLKSINLSTPTIDTGKLSSEKIAGITAHFEAILKLIGMDLSDDSLCDTPARVAKMYVNEIFWGLNPEYFPKCTTIENKMGYNEMVLEKNVNVKSTCEHHFVCIDGFATVAYIPNEKVIGLSKIGRIVEYFSKRPQVQERLTEQIYHALSHVLDTPNVAVVIDADHYCVKSRGLQDQSSRTYTSKLGGVFHSNPNTRAEFMNFVTKGK
jgi:GTP cyclohydrolase I